MELRSESDCQNLQKKFDDLVINHIKNDMTVESAVTKVISELSLKEKGSVIDLKLEDLLTEESEIINTKIAELEESIEGNDVSKVKEILQYLYNKCRHNTAFCIMLLQKRIVNIMFSMFNEHEWSEEIRIISLEILCVLIKANPWCLNEKHIHNIIPLFNLAYGAETVKLLATLFITYGNANVDHGKIICFSPILELIEGILRDNELSEDILLDICQILNIINQAQKTPTEITSTCYLIFHVSNDIVDLLITHLESGKKNEQVVKRILNTLSRITQRDSLCQRFLHCDGIRIISDIIENYRDDEAIIFSCCRLLQRLAQSDAVRNNIMYYIDASNLVSLLEKYHKSERMIHMAISFLVSLTIRHQGNSKALCENGIIDALKLCLTAHPESKVNLRKSCWLVYNIASKNREYKDQLKKIGIVEMICKTSVHTDNCYYECKAALMELGYKIDQVDKMISDKKNRPNEMMTQRNISLLLRDDQVNK